MPKRQINLQGKIWVNCQICQKNAIFKVLFNYSRLGHGDGHFVETYVLVCEHGVKVISSLVILLFFTGLYLYLKLFGQIFGQQAYSTYTIVERLDIFLVKESGVG